MSKQIKAFVLAALVIVLLALLSPGTSSVALTQTKKDQPVSTEQGIKVEITTGGGLFGPVKKSFRVGDDIPVVIIMTNMGEQPAKICISTSVLQNRPRLVKDGQLLAYVSNLPKLIDSDETAAKRECDSFSMPQTITIPAREKKTVDWFILSQGTYNLGSVKWYEPLQAGHYQLILRRRISCCVGAMVESSAVEFDVVANK